MTVDRFWHRIGVFGVGAVWAVFGAALPVLSALAGEVVDDLRSYETVPIDWHHVYWVVGGGVLGAAATALTSYYREYKALLRLPDSITEELEAARSMRTGQFPTTKEN